jgi:hypothetical protein
MRCVRFVAREDQERLKKGGGSVDRKQNTKIHSKKLNKTEKESGRPCAAHVYEPPTSWPKVANRTIQHRRTIEGC